MSIQDRLKLSGLQLPDPPAARGDYVPVVIDKGVAYVSGQVCRLADGIIKGPVRADTPAQTLILAARTCVLRALSALEQATGDLGCVERILFVRGFVHAEDGYEDYSKLLDEASRLLIELFGERGQHARSAVGVAGLPGGGLLELELVAAVRSSAP